MEHINRIEKQTDNTFINMYKLDYTAKDGEQKNYFFCTRNDDSHIRIRTHEYKSDGLCIYAVTREAHPRLVVELEYRFPVDEEIYQLPSGIIDPGETPGEAAVREMKEETGTRFVEYTGGADFCRRPFMLAPGFSDETGCAVFGFAEGFGERKLENSEWIEVRLCDKTEVRRILREEKVSLRGAFLMMQFLNAPDSDPFAFLEEQETDP